MAGRLYVPGSATDQDATVTSSEEETLSKHAEELPDTAKPVVTAFLVFVDDNGMWSVTADTDMEVSRQRDAGLHDIYAGCVSISDEISAVKAANQVAQMMDARARAVNQQMQNQQLLSKIQGGLKRG